MAVQQAMPTEGTQEWTLAHLSDAHLTSLDGLRISDILNKRLLGYLSWWRRRRHEHRPEVLEALLADLGRIKPDHVAITGDLTHLGTAREFEEAAAWLREVGRPAEVTLVPGNHDAYVPEPWDGTFSHWSDYMISDGKDAHADDDRASMFPVLRIRGGFAIIGVNSAIASAPLLSVGRVGRSQRERLAALLRQTGAAGLFRILLIHHPPVPGSIKWRKRLIDAEGFAKVVEEQGVEMLLHGHAHRCSLNWMETPVGRAPVIGVGSASVLSKRASRLAQYHTYRLRNRPGRQEITVSVRAYSPQAGRFLAVDRWRVSP